MITGQSIPDTKPVPASGLGAGAFCSNARHLVLDPGATAGKRRFSAMNQRFVFPGLDPGLRTACSAPGVLGSATSELMTKAAKGEGDIPARVQAAEDRITPNKTNVMRDISKFKPDSSGRKPESRAARSNTRHLALDPGSTARIRAQCKRKPFSL